MQPGGPTTLQRPPEAAAVFDYNIHVKARTSTLRRSVRLLTCLLLASCSGKDAGGDGITLTRIAEIGGERDGMSDLPRISGRLPDGRFVAVEQGVSAPPRLYDASGDPIGMIGRKGSGPNEYRFPYLAITSADSFIIFDGALGRATVTLGDSAVRSFPITVEPWSMVELDDGSFIASSSRLGRNLPFQHLSRDGDVLGEFADSAGIAWIARAPDGTLWSAKYYRTCQVSHWTLEGELLEERTLCDGWYVPHEEPVNPTPDIKPSSMLTGIWTDSSRVWIVGVTADSQWAEGLGQPQTGEGGMYHPIEDRDLVYDVVIDAYDIATGELLARKRLDAGLGAVVEPGMVALYGETEEGWPVAVLWEVIGASRP